METKGEVMKRIYIAGLCLVAVFAFSAMASSAAFAGEYGQCKALTKTSNPKTGKGDYTDANCTMVSVKPGKKGKPATEADKGKFEWYPGASPSCIAVKKGEFTNSACTEKASKKGKGKFEAEKCIGSGNGCAEYTSTTGVAKLVGEHGTIECKSSTDKGAITGVKTDTDLVQFENCELLGAPCTSLQKGETAKDITTEVLETTLIDHGEKGLSGLEPKEGEVWEQFSNVKGANAPYNARFDCAGIGFLRTKGSVSGTILPTNVSTIEFKTVIEKGVAEQDLETEACSSETFETCAPFEKGTQNVESGKTHNGEETEIRIPTKEEQETCTLSVWYRSPSNGDTRR
jgi:hypothetical protein